MTLPSRTSFIGSEPTFPLNRFLLTGNTFARCNELPVAFWVFANARGQCVSYYPFLDSGRAPEGPSAPRLPAAESEPSDASAAKALESGEKPPGAGVPTAQREPAPHQPQTPLAPQAVETRQETRHGEQGHSGGRKFF